MQNKNLLNLALFMAFGIPAQAQVVITEGFDAEQTKDADAVGYYEFINSQEGDERGLDAANAFEGASALKFVNSDAFSCAGQSWQRAVKFRNLPLQEGKAYRLNFMMKGSSVYADDESLEDVQTVVRPALFQGTENMDNIICDDNGQVLNQTQPIYEDWTKYSTFFYFASKAKNAELAGKEIPDTYHASINVLNPGTFYIDNVEVVEVPVRDFQFGSYTIRLDFGFKTNAAELAATAETGSYVFPEGMATVKINGEEYAVESVEAKADGYVYIYLESGFDSEDGSEFNGKVEVSFHNVDGLLKHDGLTAKGAIEDFTYSAGTFDQDVDAVSSVLYEPAKLASANPADGSFALDGSINEITITFDRPVYTCETDEANAPVAVLKGGVEDEVLILLPGQNETSKSITFVRPDGAPELAKGKYSVELTYVTTENGIETIGDEPLVLTFEVGKIQLAKTEYTDVLTHLMTGANNAIADGWTVKVKTPDDEHWTGGEVWNGGSACRNINVTGTNGEQTALYLCDRDGWTYAQYGDQEGQGIVLPAGDIEFSVIALGHEDPARTVEFRIEDMEGNVLAEGSGLTQVNANTAGAFTTVEAAGKIPVQFHNDKEQNVILKVHEPQGGYTACRVIGFKVQTYKVTEGDKPDSQVVFESGFTGANMPAEGSGWLCYDNDRQLDPGSGRNGTSGMLERNFHPKMQTAAFFRECGDNTNAAHRIEYGFGNGVEDGFDLPAGSYEVVYYAGTWNDGGGNAAGTSKVYFDIIDEGGTVVLHDVHVNIANFENGGACNGQADKVVLNFNSTGGKYKIKAWGSHNTVWGGLSFTKEGSKAAKYYQKLADAVELAKDQLTQAEDEKYNGTTKTALDAAIVKYSGELDMHTAAEFDNAVAEVEGLTKGMKARMDALSLYDNTKNDISNMVETIAEKFNALECVSTLKDTYAKYAEVPAQSLEDDELVSAANVLDFNYKTSKHMIDEGVPTLTAQINSLVAKIIEFNPEDEFEEAVIAAGDAISDDQELATMLKKVLTKEIYAKIAAGEDIFVKHIEEDPETLEDAYDEEVTHNLTGYIQNPGIYCIAEKHDATTIANYPGWNIDEEHANFGLRPNYGWGGWTGTATHLVNKNMFLGIGWVGNDGVNVWNNISDVPVGVYDLTIQTMDRSGAGDYVDGANQWPNPERQLSYIYYQLGENEPVTTPFRNENLGQYYGFTDCPMEDITVTAENPLVKIGAYIHAQESFAAIQQVSLTLKGKVEGFDYAAAAKALEEEIATSIKTTEFVGEPVDVKYYGIDGVQSAVKNGIAIKVETYKNGAVKVSKVLRK